MAQSVNRDQLRVGVGSVCRHALGAVEYKGILGVSKLVSEFVSDPISEVLIFFFLHGFSTYILRGFVPYLVILRGDLY